MHLNKIILTKLSNQYFEPSLNEIIIRKELHPVWLLQCYCILTSQHDCQEVRYAWTLYNLFRGNRGVSASERPLPRHLW